MTRAKSATGGGKRGPGKVDVVDALDAVDSHAAAETVAAAVPERKPRAEVAAPVYPTCPHAGCRFVPASAGERPRVEYTSPLPEAGVRMVTASCRRCGGLMWWYEKMSAESN